MNKPLTLVQFRLLEAAVEDLEYKFDEPDFQECYESIREGTPSRKIKQSDFAAVRSALEDFRSRMKLEAVR